MKPTQLNVQISPEAKNKLMEIAKEKDLSLSQLIRRIINQYLKKYEESKQE